MTLICKTLWQIVNTGICFYSPCVCLPVVLDGSQPEENVTTCGSPHIIDSNRVTGNTRDVGSISGSGRHPGGGNATHFSILAWKIPWTEEPGGYSLWGHKESDATEHHHHQQRRRA